MVSNSILPQDIILLILSRLPPNSIGRCRCVSKPWRAMLSTTDFIKTHLHLATKLQPQNVILLSKSGSLFSLPLTFTNAHQVFDEMSEPPTKLNFDDKPHIWSKVIASCGGLLLVSDNKGKIFLVNPATREIKQVPPSPFAIQPVTEDRSPCGRYVFVKDEEGNKHLIIRSPPSTPFQIADRTKYGLGYDSVNDDYKVVTLSFYIYGDSNQPSKSTELFANVYSVKNGTWAKAETFTYGRLVRRVTSVVFANGSIHWIASEGKFSYGQIVAFDLAQEKFYEVDHPRSIGGLMLVSFVELGGCLCVTREYWSCGSEVWILKEYGNTDSWTNFILVVPEETLYKPLCVLGQDQMVLVKNPWEECHRFVKYDMGKGSFKDIKLHGISEDLQAKGTFVESLVSPHCSH